MGLGRFLHNVLCGKWGKYIRLVLIIRLIWQPILPVSNVKKEDEGKVKKMSTYKTKEREKTEGR